MQSVSGELVRHHDQPFLQSKAPKFFWAGCLGPLVFIVIVIFLAYEGAKSEAGILAIRGYIVFILVYLIFQFLLGGGLFMKGRSSFAKGLMIGSVTIFLLLILGMIGLFTVLHNFLG